MRLWLPVLLALLGATAAQAQSPIAWTQLVDGGVAEARVVADGPTCPEAMVDGEPRPMKLRAAPDDTGFPNRVCTLALPRGAASISVGGHALPPVPARIDRIVVLGDTGCRVKGLLVQACNDPRAWPFALVSKRAAAEKPDLVIHVGDYYYRESACPPLLSACVGSPHGDLWPSWDADFFAPARPLLDAAPWVFARGNHENCARGWKGWSRMLEAGPPMAACGESPAFHVPIGGAVTLHVLDSADADDRIPAPASVALVRRQLDTLPRGGKGEDWIVTHRPIWGEAPVFSFGPMGVFTVGLNRTEQAAARGQDLSAVAMIVSGHVHHFASFDFGEARPAQLVAGTGGDVGEKADRARPYTATVSLDGLDAESFTFQQFGYFLLERSPGHPGWTGVFKDLDGKVVARCTLDGRRLKCGKA